MATRRANREREILDVAARLFAARGYSATSVDDIAAAVGLNKAMLYYYFSSKAGLLYHVYLTTADDLAERLDIGDDDTPADEALAAIMRAIVDAISHAPDYVTVFFQELQWLPKWLPPDELKVIRVKQAEFLAILQRVIERGIADGTFRPVDVPVAVSALVGMAGWTYRAHGQKAVYSPKELSDTLVAMAIGALAPGVAAAPAAPPVPAGRARRRSAGAATA